VTFCESASLEEVYATATWAREMALQRKDYDMALVPDAHARHAAALRGGASAADRGRATLSDEDLQSRLGPETPTGLFYERFCNAELAYLAGDAARADALLREANTGAQVISGLPTIFELCLLECLVAAKLWDDAPGAEKTRLVDAIEA